MKKIIALLVIGVAVKLFLDSESGREIKNRVWELISDLQDAINEKLESLTGKIEETASRVDKVMTDVAS